MFCKLILPRSSGVALAAVGIFSRVWAKLLCRIRFKKGRSPDSGGPGVHGRRQDTAAPLVLLEAHGHRFSCRAQPRPARSPARPVHASFSFPSFSFGGTFWGRGRDCLLIWSCSPLVPAVSVCWLSPRLLGRLAPRQLSLCEMSMGFGSCR